MKKSIQLIQDFVILDRLGNDIKVPVRYSNRAKHIAIKINHKGAELVLPNKNLNAGYRFLLQKESWIRQKLQYSIKLEPIDTSTIVLFGKIYSLEFVNANYDQMEINDDIIIIHSSLSQHKEVLTKFLKEILLSKIMELADFFKNKYNLYFTKIKIMNNKAKWGSCSNKGILSFNWRLIFAPLEILEYLVAHEISHILEMNHSKNFWNLVEKLYPNYQSARLWLKENGNNLPNML